MIILNQKFRFMLVGLTSQYIDSEKMIADFEELELLVNTFGGKVFAALTQSDARRDNATYIGKGKAQEVADKIAEEKIDIVVINANIKPGQLYTLKKIFERSNPAILVWDRVDLIIQIFSKHASTAESKLQIKLANIRHMGPRIYGMGLVLSQQGGGIGTKGMGETNTEIMKRHYRFEIKNINNELDKIKRNKYQQMDHRKRNGLSTISIVGYTNSGKTSLFNILGKQKNLVDNSLFVTLDSSVCKFYLPILKKEVYLSDTIGFIQNLPHQLIDAFRSTLMETVNADIILHVIDASDPWINDKIKTVEEILYDLGIENKNQIYVFNKIDIAKNIDIPTLTDQYDRYNPQFISARTGAGIDNLTNQIQIIIAANPI